MKVLRHLNDVRTVLYGDFLSCGIRQALFLPRESCSRVVDSAADILSVVDAEMEATESNADKFGRRFLLTDFAQVSVDRWNLAAVVLLYDTNFCLSSLFAINFKNDFIFIYHNSKLCTASFCHSYALIAHMTGYVLFLYLFSILVAILFICH